MRWSICIAFAALLISCSAKKQTLFTKLGEDETGINFRNLLKEEYPEFNIVLYPYFYNGGGVAIGDINNDGLPDICFTGNMVKNRLFLNKGNFNFEDITEKAGIATKEGWCTGVTMVDINNDGKLDVYICRSGLSNAAFRTNLLYINNGDLSFKESAAEYGLADAGYSTQASFFDYDKDGDLDMMLINQSSPEYSKGMIEYVRMRSRSADSTLSNKLFRNDNGHYVDVSKQAGIVSNPLTFSLGISTTDFNNDGWPDIYIANDFKEPDYYYINNHDGTFTDQLHKSFAHTSLYAMGIDAADYNNDALPDLVELDMLPESNHAQKMHMGTDGFDQYDPLFRQGMPYQFMKNSLQKNNGDGTFSEIGQLAGISNTDWSWTPMLCDFDNDGKKDLFVTNGYKRDNTELEFVKYSLDQSAKMQQGASAVSAAEYISHMPGIRINNYMFQNEGNDHFANKSFDWGFDEMNYSHGAAYADLDNDGDLDLITNNTDEYAGIYKNNAEAAVKNNYLKVKLEGNKGNSAGIGTKVYVMTDGQTFYQEQNPVRGYCSSMDQQLNFGLGKIAKADSLVVVWNSGKAQTLKNIATNQTLTIKQSEAVTDMMAYDHKVKPLFTEDSSIISFQHKENEFNDFTVQTLLPSYLSRQGPCLVKADVNKDGREDMYVGGAKGQAGVLFLQDISGKFVAKPQAAFVQDAMMEDVAALFFDADKDGDADLYVASGGYEFAPNDPLLQGRLYINDGKGNFTKAVNSLPKIYAAASCVKATDIDKDGDLDLFIGGRAVPGQYPVAAASYILLNDGKGIFTDATTSICPALKNIGMATDATLADLNKDGFDDLMLVGEWMSPHVFINQKGKLTDNTNQWISFAANGWWNAIAVDDFDSDGDIDIVLGNQGLNNQFIATANKPMTIAYKDFDNNGYIDPFMFYYVGDTSYPAFSRDDIVQQVPSLNKRFLLYTDYADITKANMFPAADMAAAKVDSAIMLETIYLENKGGSFVLHHLPVEAQYAPVSALLSIDANGDGKKDILLAGNNSHTRIRFGHYDASYGSLFLGDGKNNFAYVRQYQSGFHVFGDVKHMIEVNNKIIFGVNNAGLAAYRFN